MKLQNLSVAGLLIFFSFIYEKVDADHLFILSGQSNMVGIKPEQSFTPMVEEAFGKDSVVVVKDASSGQPIRKWFKNWKPSNNNREYKEPNGMLYDRLIKKVTAAIEGKKLNQLHSFGCKAREMQKRNMEKYMQKALSGY